MDAEAIATAEAAVTVKTATLLVQNPGSSPGFFFTQNHRFSRLYIEPRTVLATVRVRSWGKHWGGIGAPNALNFCMKHHKI